MLFPSVNRSLDKNEYNHITATYFLLAERKLRSKRQDQVNKNKRPEKLAVPQATPVPKHDISKGPSPCLLSVPRTPGDIPQVNMKSSSRKPFFESSVFETPKFMV